MSKQMTATLSRKEQLLIEDGDLFFVQPDPLNHGHAHLSYICKLPKKLRKKLEAL